jgi:hypothetical protein
MGIDIHVHDVYIAVAHGPIPIVLALVVIAAGLFAALKLLHVVRMMLTT